MILEEGSHEIKGRGGIMSVVGMVQLGTDVGKGRNSHV